MTTPAKLYGKDLSEYDEVDVDELLAQLSAEEIKILAKEVDPDVSVFYLSKLLFFLLKYQANETKSSYAILINYRSIDGIFWLCVQCPQSKSTVLAQ